MKGTHMRRREFTRTLAALPLAAALPGFASPPQARKSDETRERLTLPPGGSITDVPGIRVGHDTLSERPTGCTVVLCERGGAVGGVDVRGSAPGTRETDLLSPTNLVDRVNAVLLSGGSAYGLDAATGVMRYLEEHHSGFRIGQGVVPIVPAAILFDLGVGDFHIRPNAESGYRACEAAIRAGTLAEGTVGAGAGATVGKMFGAASATKGGIGTASVTLGETGLVVGALVAVNAIGDIRHSETGEIVAGARVPDSNTFRDTLKSLLAGERVLAQPGANTTIGVVATNAAFSKVQMTKIAQMTHDGYARAINPVHTMSDGDTVFALSTGIARVAADETAIGAIAALVMQRAIVRAVMKATGLPQFGIPAWRDLQTR
jgi:L-aminopeptidase/D-esterase-like protein